MNVYSLLEYLGKTGIKTVVTLHAEFFFTGGCSHSYECLQWVDGCKKCDVYKKVVSSWFFDRAETSWKKMYNAFSYFKPENIKIVAVSPWLEVRAKRASILKRFDVRCVFNGVNTKIFQLNGISTKHLEHNHNRINILFVTAYFSTSISDSKGGGYLVELAKICPEYNFIIVSRRFDPNNGPLPNNVKIYGSTNNQRELAELYSEADLSITLGKRETFSMIVAESLCCGTPIVGFQAGGPESIGLPDCSRFVRNGDINGLKSEIEEVLGRQYNRVEIANRAQSEYSDSQMVNGYFQCYTEFNTK